ncbi:hypothetical protein GN244_ATG10928 [Phytophthora infestans]|uniref:Uncharacterized protein n=1 Tax=Phytophthora infestans TaxID=4787 RepID=A0A833S0G7_PHYIN|nr:hypothetical protein GN244_ATG10928 [Phytophthora infestans]KAF4136178.1 hypothetical protein GN958_ATG14618 [Phytophthora infestans]KAF4146982.1 hypothetical protein GN958_ATG03869 [Phytophthora infestans]
MATLFIAKCETVITGDALARAVEKDDVEMLRVLFEKSNYGSARDALARAVALNRVEMLDVVLEDSSSDTIEQALVQAGYVGTTPMVSMLLRQCDPSGYGRIFDNAARRSIVGLVQLLLDKMNVHNIRCDDICRYRRPYEGGQSVCIRNGSNQRPG